jgi:hypothetical protein
MVFIDHDKSVYYSDLLLIEQHELLHSGIYLSFVFSFSFGIIIGNKTELTSYCKWQSSSSKIIIKLFYVEKQGKIYSFWKTSLSLAIAC